MAEEPLPLILKYRPQNLKQMYGHDQVLKALRELFDSESSPHSYLFVGPSGIGKTTLARIVAGEMDIPENSITEIDAATYRGIDNMRQITATARYEAFGKNPRRLIIVDECHALSKDTWQTLLKVLEEPPSHLYWCLCTTEQSKVPKTIQTRCATFTLKPLSQKELFNLLADIREAEKWKGIPADSILDVCYERAEGSPRQAIQNLSTARGCRTRQEAIDLISKALDSGDSLDLARLLCNPQKCTWKSVIPLLKQIADINNEQPETVRLTVVNYAARYLLGKAGEKPLTDAKQVAHLLHVLEQFSNFFPEAEKFGPLLLACARVAFAEDVKETK